MNEKPKSKSINSTENLLAVFLEVPYLQIDRDISARKSSLGNGRVELKFEAGKKKQAFEVLPKLNPSRKELWLQTGKSGKPFLLLAPHIADPLAEDLRAAGISHTDLNGRLFLKTPTFWLQREPKRLTYRNPGTELNPFTLKSSRVVRALLSHREREWTQADLERRTGISRALISLTLNDLIERELLAQIRPGNRHEPALYRVKDFGRLLEAWSKADDWRKRASIQQYSLLAANLTEVAKTARDALGEDDLFLTQWFAAHLRHPYTSPPLVSAYLKRHPVGEISWGRKVDNGGNLWLIIPKDEGVFQEPQQVGGFNLVSDVQIYLDLLPVGQRGPDQAQALRDWEDFAR